MTYDYRERKTVVLLSSKIDVGVALNVVGHLSLAIGANAPSGLMGRPYLEDASGVPHRGISRFPVIVLKTRPSKVIAALEGVRKNPSLVFIDYPSEMLDTGHDDELAAALSMRRSEEIEYFGIAAHGPTSDVDKVFSSFSLWRLDGSKGGA